MSISGLNIRLSKLESALSTLNINTEQSSEPTLNVSNDLSAINNNMNT